MFDEIKIKNIADEKDTYTTRCPVSIYALLMYYTYIIY